MTPENQNLIKQAYAAFNKRDIDAAFTVMHPEVHWPNGWEGGYVNGHEEVREYWTRQWKEINPHVEPVAFKERDGQTEVEVHQLVKDLSGNVLFDGMINHVYTIENGLIIKMDIEKV